jgi:hypothetical protein
VWSYDDESHVQKLEGFVALCDLCHHVKHLGLASILAVRGELDYQKVVRHFMEVNNCDRETFEEHKREAFKQHSDRSQHLWTVDLGRYEYLKAER